MTATLYVLFKDSVNEDENDYVRENCNLEAQQENHLFEEVQKEEQRQQQEMNFQEELKKIMETEKVSFSGSKYWMYQFMVIYYEKQQNKTNKDQLFKSFCLIYVIFASKTLSICVLEDAASW